MMKRLLFIVLIAISFSGYSKDQDEEQTPLPTDTLVYQFGNDTLIQTLIIHWSCDTMFNFSFTTENLRTKGERNIRGQAFKLRADEEPIIKSYLDKEFPAEKYYCQAAMCPLSFYVQYLHKERVWVEADCKRKEMFARLPMHSVGMFERIQ
jgi:hypothetical protein